MDDDWGYPPISGNLWKSLFMGKKPMDYYFNSWIQRRQSHRYKVVRRCQLDEKTSCEFWLQLRAVSMKPSHTRYNVRNQFG